MKWIWNHNFAKIQQKQARTLIRKPEPSRGATCQVPLGIRTSLSVHRWHDAAKYKKTVSEISKLKSKLLKMIRGSKRYSRTKKTRHKFTIQRRSACNYACRENRIGPDSASDAWV